MAMMARPEGTGLVVYRGLTWHTGIVYIQWMINVSYTSTNMANICNDGQVQLMPKGKKNKEVWQ